MLTNTVKTLKFLCILVTVWSPAIKSYSLQCTELLSNQQNSVEFSGTLAVEQLRFAVENFDPNEKIPLTKQEVQDFASKDGSLKLLLPLIQRSEVSLTTSLWFVPEADIFNSPDMETPESVSVIEPLYDKYHEFMLGKSTSLKAVKTALKPKGSFPFRVSLAREMKTRSAFLSLMYGKEINLLTEAGLLDFFSVANKAELLTKRHALLQQNLALNSRIHKLLQADSRHGVKINRELELSMFEVQKPEIHPSDIALFKVGPSKKEVVELIELIGLSEKEKKSLLSDLNKLEDTFYSSKYQSNWKAHTTYTMLLFKAYEMKFSPIQHPAAKNGAGKSLTSKAFHLVKMRIQQQSYARAVIDAQMETYVDKTEELNERIKSLSAASKRREARHPHHRDDYQSISTRLEELTITDFGSNMKRREGVLAELELELDSVTELALKETRNENIEDFADLNNRWVRLLPNKKYKLDGSDYEYVSFSQDVIDAFKDQPLVGTRYLAALSKSYVSMKKASGLRMITSIHKLFRDIKLIAGTAKIRVVGKLIDGNIQFFYVYKSEKPYNTPEMGKLLDRFEGL